MHLFGPQRKHVRVVEEGEEGSPFFGGAFSLPSFFFSPSPVEKPAVASPQVRLTLRARGFAPVVLPQLSKLGRNGFPGRLRIGFGLRFGLGARAFFLYIYMY